MNFYGTIDRITKTDAGVEVRLSKRYYLDENIEEPVKLIQAERCDPIPDEILKISGVEIDEYDVDDEAITLWPNWYDNGKPIKIPASGITVEDREYEIEDYSRALAHANEAWQEQHSEIHALKQTISSINEFLDHELDNLARRVEFQPDRVDAYSKAITILKRLRRLTK